MELAWIKQRNVRNFFELGKTKIAECSEGDVPAWCIWLMKRFIRTGFYLCMPRLHQHAIDAPTQLQVFGDYYPEKLTKMKQAYVWSKDPTSDRQELLTFIHSFGEWLTREAEKVLSV